MISKETLDRNFKLVEKAAIKGERCPQSKPFGPLDSSATRALAIAGRLRIEIFMHNYRVATIMEGQHKGKQTKAPPKQGTGKPYKVIYKDHVTLNTRTMRQQSGPITLPKINLGS